MENDESHSRTLLQRLGHLRQIDELRLSQQVCSWVLCMHVCVCVCICAHTHTHLQDILTLLQVTSKILTLQADVPEYSDSIVEEIATLTQQYLSTTQRILTTLQVAESQARLLPNNNSYFGEYLLCSLRRTVALKAVQTLDQLQNTFAKRFARHALPLNSTLHTSG
uniref:Quinolinate synthase A n=1 Tax=Lygus hesperus TaxID=30085 RepID=A0A0A9W526_LYGHE